MNSNQRWGTLPNLLSVVLGSVLAGCGDSAPTSAPQPPQGASKEPPAVTSAPAPGSVIEFETCGGYDLNAAAEMLGLAATDLEDRSKQQSWGKDCTFVKRGDVMFENVVAFTLSRDESVAAAEVAFDQLRGHAGISDQIMAAGQSHRVADLGDEALWVAASSSLYVRDGDVTILVSLPKDETTQQAVARRLLR
jgi:hypothetical protein